MEAHAFPDPYKNRVAIVGKTGTGKTTVAAALTAGLERAIFVDPKHSKQMGETFGNLEPWAGPQLTRRPSFKNAIRSLAQKGLDDYERSILLQRRMENGEPFRAWFRPSPKYDYENLWQYVYENLTDVTVYIDELYLTLKTLGRTGTYLHALYTQGRERGIAVWSCMQRPKWVPLVALSESEWFYIFRLNVDDDRKVIRTVIGDVAMRPLTGHQFIMYNDADESASLHDGIEQE